MSRTLIAVAALLALAAGAGGQPAPPGEEPSAPTAGSEATGASRATSSWRHNPRARTSIGIERLAEGETEAALEAFDEASSLAPDDPRLQFNAGTARLLADGEPPVALLTEAAEAAPADLGADAYYNLGNARLTAGDPAAAIEAFEQSLRVAPDKLEAKHNLELAQRLLEQQKQQEQQRREQQADDEGRDQEQQEQPQPDGRSEEEDQGQDRKQPQPPDESTPRPGDQPPDDSRQPLPDFEEQPEMTAEQAAAILEAVENLEREQRRKQALEQRKRAKGDRDW